jgi:hypothetical protein
MNPIRAVRRSAGILAWLASVLLASADAAPAALASPLRPDPPWWLTHRALPVHLPPELRASSGTRHCRTTLMFTLPWPAACRAGRSPSSR